MILKTLLLFLLLGIIPVILGLPWTITLPHKNRFRILACFPLGYYIELAIFHILAVPFGLFGWSFTILGTVFSCMMAVVIVMSIKSIKKNKPVYLVLPHLSKWELMYLLPFCALLVWQLYNGLIGDVTYWSYDDAVYVTYGADAVRYNRILSIVPYTGIASVGIDASRALQTSLFFPGFLTLITGISITTINRTVLEVFYIFLTYMSFAYMASVLFKKKENGIIFLILLSVLHIWGFYSQYSITFRILGPDYQGKAVLAASLCPFFFTFMIQILQERYNRKAGAILAILSLASVALTNFGIVISLINIILVVFLSLFRKERKWKHLWYLLYGCIFPVIYGSIYLIYRYLWW